MRVPLVDLAAQHAEVADEVRDGWDAVLAKTAFIGGPQVAEFEQAYAREIGVDHCIGVGNGTDALEFALRASGVDSSGEVILPANTFIATAEAVARIGARPVLVDVDPTYLLIDPDRVAEAITERTQAIVPVHLFGQTAPVERLEPLAAQCGAAIVEDAAQSQGARRHGRAAGSLGTAAGTSFYPGKNLGAAGDAGAVLTNDPEVARRARLLGAHGSEQKYVHESIGFNSRLDTLQAVVLSAKLRRLPAWNRARQLAAARYNELFATVPGVVTPVADSVNEDVWHLYVVRVQERDRVLAELQSAGIGAGIHYPEPVHLTDAFSGLGYVLGDFPIAEDAASQILSLPLFPHIAVEQQTYVVAQVADAMASVHLSGEVAAARGA